MDAAWWTHFRRRLTQKCQKAARVEAAFVYELKDLQLRHEPPAGVRIVIRNTGLCTADNDGALYQ